MPRKPVEPELPIPAKEVIVAFDKSGYVVGNGKVGESGVSSPVVRLSRLMNWPGSLNYNKTNAYFRLSLGVTGTSWWEINGCGLHMLYTDNKVEAKPGSILDLGPKNLDIIRPFVTPIDSRIYVESREIITALGTFAYSQVIDPQDFRSLALEDRRNIPACMEHLTNEELANIKNELTSSPLHISRQILREIDPKEFAAHGAKSSKRKPTTLHAIADLFAEYGKDYAMTLLRAFCDKPTIRDRMIDHHLGDIRRDAGEISVQQMATEPLTYLDQRYIASNHFCPLPDISKLSVLFVTNDKSFWKQKEKETGTAYIDHGGAPILAIPKQVFGPWLLSIADRLNAMDAKEKDKLFTKMGPRFRQEFNTFCAEARKLCEVIERTANGFPNLGGRWRAHTANGGGLNPDGLSEKIAQLIISSAPGRHTR